MRFLNLEQLIKNEITHRKISLLEKDLTHFNNALHSKIDNKSALVIGGAGTIGSSYIKALLKFNIRRLYVVDINENGLTELVRDLRSSTEYNIPDDVKTYPISFGDNVLKKIIQNEGPFEIVANFAAHKHVRSEKDEYSIEAMINNNVIKAKGLLDILLNHKPEHFFCVSTDKAANPVNIMGASKKLMEEMIMAYSSQIPITTARFANVAFSNGSLPLGFIERLNKQQPWSCPTDVRRFFVSPEESGQICLIASILGESGDIFFPKLDMEKDMIPFSDIALKLLATLGLKPDICQSEEEARQKTRIRKASDPTYPIYFFQSETSGEKPYEEFYTEHEVLDNDSFKNLGIIKNAPKKDIAEIQAILNQLDDLFDKQSVTKNEIVKILQTYLPNFDHIETGKSLDQKM